MKNEKHVEIGRRIAGIRNENNQSQESLAEMLSLTPKHISNIENGAVGISLSALTRFCTLYGCSMDYIVFGSLPNPELDVLPPKIIEIICRNNENETRRLRRHLEYFLEMEESFRNGLR